MTTTESVREGFSPVSAPTSRDRLRASAVNGSPALLALVALVVIFAITASLQPGILSVPGLTLMLMSSVPLVFAAQAQMVIMSVGDIDLSVGSLVSLVTVIGLKHHRESVLAFLNLSSHHLPLHLLRLYLCL